MNTYHSTVTENEINQLIQCPVSHKPMETHCSAMKHKSNKRKHSITKATGTELFFGCSKSPSFLSSTIHGERVHPSDRFTKLSQLNDSGPMFFACKNMKRFPDCLKGIIFACSETHIDNKWQLGVINKLIKHNQLMEVLLWKGDTVERENKINPLFFFYTSEKITATMKACESNCKHFEKQTIDMDKFVRFCYLNQINGIHLLVY